MEHPQVIKKTLLRCEAKAIESRDFTCKSALRAFQDVRYLLFQAEQNSQDFGEEIIKTQMRLARDAGQETNNELAENQLKLVSYFSIIRLQGL